MIIVTGGAGFIGSNLVKGLNDAGRTDIIVVDNLASTQKYLNLNRLKIADYIDKTDLLDRINDLGPIDLILHQGACSATTELDANYLIRNNYEYSKALLHYAQKHKVPFIYASSASVYGNGDDGFIEDPKCEYPLNGYAFSKFLFDNYVRQNIDFNTSDSPVVGLRYFNVYGPQENHKGSMASVPFHFFNQAKANGQINVFEGSETFLRDFVYIEDVVNVVNFFIESGKSGIFNCGTGNERSFMDMANTFADKFGNCQIGTIPFPEHLKGKYQTFTKADLTALRSIGYKGDFMTLEQGVEKYLTLLKEQNGFY